MSEFQMIKPPKYFKYTECNEGDVLIEDGTYEGQQEGKYGIQHKFMQDGEPIILNSAGHLNRLLEDNVVEGDRCHIVFGGKRKLEKGDFAGKEYNHFELGVIKGNRSVMPDGPVDVDGENLDDLA